MKIGEMAIGFVRFTTIPLTPWWKIGCNLARVISRVRIDRRIEGGKK
jgi:hypothetical protein